MLGWFLCPGGLLIRPNGICDAMIRGVPVISDYKSLYSGGRIANPPEQSAERQILILRRSYPHTQGAGKRAKGIGGRERGLLNLDDLHTIDFVMVFPPTIVGLAISSVKSRTIESTNSTTSSIGIIPIVTCPIRRLGSALIKMYS